MFERFSDRARRVVVLAQEEARHLNHNYIGTEHVLLGILAEGEGVAAKALNSMGVTLDKVRDEVEAIIGQGGSTPSGHIPFTPRAKRVLELGLREALSLGHKYIGTEHILLGLLREGQGVGCQVLVKLGANLSKVRERLITTLSESREATDRWTFVTPLAEQLHSAGMELAENWGHERMGTDHLLVALLGQSESAAVRFLQGEGIDVEALRDRLEQALEEAGNSTDP